VEGLTPSNPLRWRRALIRLVLSGAALALILTIVDLDDLLGALSSVSISTWVTALLGFLTLHFLSAMKWRFVMGLTGHKISPRLTIRAYGLGLFANLCLPSLIGGDVIRAGVIMKNGGPKEVVLFAALTDRFLDIIGLGSLVAIGFLLAPSAFNHIGDLSKTQENIILSGTIFVVIGAFALPLVLRRLRPRSLPRKIGRIWIGFIRSWRGLLSSPKKALLALLWCTLLQVGFVGVNIYLGRSMGLTMDPRMWFLLWPLAKIAAMAPVSLGGIGVREVAFVALAGSFAPKDLLLAQSLTWESTLVAGGILFGALSLLAKEHKDNHDA
jgi:uncharacterized membrane protein YbhN (UPF0104 family)